MILLFNIIYFYSLESDSISDRSRVFSFRPNPIQLRNGRLKVNRIVGPEAYYMGIVDFQQLYNISKKVSFFYLDYYHYY